MSSKKNIDLQEIEEKYNFHKNEAEKWEMVLNALKELPSVSDKQSSSRGVSDEKIQSPASRAVKICVDILKVNPSGQPISSFVSAIKKEGIQTKNGRPFVASNLSSILGQSGIVKFNQETRLWELIK